ncbi:MULTISPECIES: DUF2752 domain-containing protein [Eubacterium]|uniref:DUF2752 domain-containing protein n=1 Tax=Eubacterium album TaxID=2978477 RepID=A0ABT2M0I4_9FIRM|nr:MULTISPECIES: DUF2752 domain-containing protein [unclassified Eubacterium (in: firmicutes)]MCT7399040.1 DUF2752 domain-containing protein [Eubacterium sp. LFL-14]
MINEIKKIINNIFKDIKKYYPLISCVIIYIFITSLIFNDICPSKILFKISCPGCGLTRGSISLLTGHFKAAMHYNAAAVIWDIGIAMMFVQRYILEKKYKYMDYYWIVCCGLTIVYYIIRMIYYTPAGFPI